MMEIWLGDDVETVFDKRKKPKDSLWVHHTQHNRMTKKNDGGLWCRVVTMEKKRETVKETSWRGNAIHYRERTRVIVMCSGPE